ncbi:hypothetical protein RRR72_001360 [Citrobacter freundii]|nr:hypothetical protein [Citrobacter freundii]
MRDIQRLLLVLLNHDVLRDEEDKVIGITRAAVDKGYDTLSPAQKNVLTPFLTRRCDGVIDPGDHHNDCNEILSGDELADAYEQEDYYEAILCTHCRELYEEYSNSN